MIRIIIVILIGGHLSCTSRSIPESNGYSNQKLVQLVDSLGTLTFDNPMRFDTSFSWIHYSDCGKNCDEQKYRFQSKKDPVLKESGWIWHNDSKDSIDRFTISHMRYVPFHDGDTSKNYSIHNHLREELKFDHIGMSIVLDTILKINDRYFSLFELESTDSIFKKEVLAFTTIKSNPIRFSCELRTRVNDSKSKDFFKNSFNLISTIVISKGI